MGYSKLRVIGLAAVVVLVAACGSTSTGGSPSPSAKVVKVGLVTDIGGLNDKSFNHLADVGLEKAKTDFHIQGDVTE
jgi:basic membrane protein A